MILHLFLLSRVIIISICLLSRLFISCFDTSSTLLYTSNISLFSCFANWDGLYYLKIAESGYEFEKIHAFFPLFPLLIRLVSSLFYPLRFFLDTIYIHLISAFLINHFAFFGAAKALYDLTIEVICSEKLARLAVICLCFSPASIFFASFYTESLFSFFSFFGLLLLFRGQYWSSSFSFALASFTRSNGIILAGFPLYIWLQGPKSFRSTFRMISSFFLIVLPFFAFQWYGYSRYCSLESPPSYCSSWFPPTLYSFVQKQYWGVGLFAYYRIEQIPNFLLASPILILSIYCVYRYFIHDVPRFLSLGFLVKKPSTHFFSSRVLVFIYHLIALLMVCFTVLHVQVSTRFLSASSPVLYWFVAFLVQSGSRWVVPLKMYSLLFFTAGCVLFSNFFPWT